MIVLNTLAPLVLIVLLGGTLRRTGFMSRAFFKENTRLVYWVGLPCLLFDKTSATGATGNVALRIFVILITGTLGCVLLGYAAARLLGLRRRSVGAFVQGAYRGNLAYVGLAVVLFSLDGGNKALAGAAALALAPLIPIYNFIAVTVLLAGQEHDPTRLTRRAADMAWKICTNPLLLACVAGGVFAVSGWPVPLVVRRTCSAIGQMALPLALLGIGASLAFRSFHGAVVPSAVAAAIKVVCCPLIGLAAARGLGAGPEETRVALLFLACPTAVVSFVMAEQLGADEQLAGSIIVLSTLAATASLAAVLLWT